jgi:UDP-N-acetylglucosamine--N-acetylmuramyl-(pentapeptide) pyrophosphoryl-undecaprenol N-acetylglucosamine transferase
MIQIAFTGGGTGGHIYPGLAVAEELKTRLAGQEYRIFWIGSDKGMDRSIVEGAGLEFFGIPAGKLRRYFSLRTIPDVFKVAAGFFAARSVLKKQRADILFSKGGFVSVPPCAAAASLGIPVYTHESDFTPGLATRLNLRFVQRTGGRVFTAYTDTVNFLPAAVRDRVTVSGNPVRAAFRSSAFRSTTFRNAASRSAADPAAGRAFLGLGPQERILLVLGGSQGAAEVNTLIRDSLDSLRRYYTVVHQYGPEQQWDMQRIEPSEEGAPSGEGGGYIPLPYIKDEMSHVLAAAELVVGRSGAGTVWESAALGKPMILIPLSGSGTRGDQVENARFFEREGAAQVLSDGDGPAGSEKLSRMVSAIAEDHRLRGAMAEAAKRIGSLDGAAIIGDSISKAIYREYL